MLGWGCEIYVGVCVCVIVMVELSSGIKGSAVKRSDLMVSPASCHFYPLLYPGV